MNIGVFLVDNGTPTAREGYACADALIESVRETMPGVPVVQLTDDNSRAITSVDDVKRRPLGPHAVMRYAHQAKLDGDWLFVDTDVLFQQDVRKVFQAKFDIAVTTRNWPHLKPAAGFTEAMPFNTGVVFSKSRDFWKVALKRLVRLSREKQEFIGHQEVICDLVAEGNYRVLRLKGSKYNCPPYVAGLKGGDAERSHELVQGAAIVHYKGASRKALMFEHIAQRRAVCA